MSKFDYILTHWFKIKLKQKDKESDLWRSEEDTIFVTKLYEEFEERKRLKKIKFSLMFKKDFTEKET